MSILSCGQLERRGTIAATMTIGAACLVATTSTAHAGFLLESRATFVHLRDLDDGTPIFHTENPARGFRAFASDGHPLDPVIPLSDLVFYNFTMTSTNAHVVRQGYCEYAGDYEIRFGSFGTAVPPSVVSSGTFSISLSFIDGDNATVTGQLLQDPSSVTDEFPDFSYGGNPIAVEGHYHHTYFPDGTWSGGGMLIVDFRQTAVPSPGALAVLALGACVRRRRRAVDAAG